MDCLAQPLKHTHPTLDLTANANIDPPHKHTFMFTSDTPREAS